jgi:hypothetical protein
MKKGFLTFMSWDKPAIPDNGNEMGDEVNYPNPQLVVFTLPRCFL